MAAFRSRRPARVACQLGSLVEGTGAGERQCGRAAGEPGEVGALKGC